MSLPIRLLTLAFDTEREDGDKSFQDNRYSRYREPPQNNFHLRDNRNWFSRCCFRIFFRSKVEHSNRFPTRMKVCYSDAKRRTKHGVVEAHCYSALGSDNDDVTIEWGEKRLLLCVVWRELRVCVSTPSLTFNSESLLLLFSHIKINLSSAAPPFERKKQLDGREEKHKFFHSKFSHTFSLDTCCAR